MARKTGSSAALEPLKVRDPEAFEEIEKKIRKLGGSVVARRANLSKQQIWNFLSGNQNVSPEAERKIYKAVEIITSNKTFLASELSRLAKEAASA